LYFVSTRILESASKMRKRWQEQGKIRRCHCFGIAGNAYYKGDTKWRCITLMLVSLYTE
jgi:hypothetical protein